MNVNGVNSTAMQPNTTGMGAGSGGQTDSVSKDLQNQIEKLQQDLKEISANQDMPTEIKMKKRQEIQKQISELQIQLRQHQMEVKKEERQKKKDESSFDDLMGTKPQKKQDGTQNAGMSAGSMEAMISADVSVKQANVNGSTAKKMDGRANVLEMEIKLDGGRGGSSNVELKEAELAKAKEAAQNATASQMDSLAQASETLQNAAKDDRVDGQKKEDEKKAPGMEEEKEEGTSNAPEEALEGAGYAYHPVDVRL
ncbi:MAG: FlxA-like family protein [Lachnospiraceae bacterium]|nr:FlxA-like family protein [Lachnospiraceae bacterium]